MLDQKSCKNCFSGDWLRNTPPDICNKAVCVECRYTGEDNKEPSNWKPMSMTYADLIRSKSDEDLVEWLMKFMVASIKAHDKTVEVDFTPGFSDGLLQKLKSPVETEGCDAVWW